MTAGAIGGLVVGVPLALVGYVAVAADPDWYKPHAALLAAAVGGAAGCIVGFAIGALVGWATFRRTST